MSSLEEDTAKLHPDCIDYEQTSVKLRYRTACEARNAAFEDNSSTYHFCDGLYDELVADTREWPLVSVWYIIQGLGQFAFMNKEKFGECYSNGTKGQSSDQS